MVLLATGCSALPGTGDKGYVTADGVVSQLAAAQRGAPVELTGVDLAGDPVDLADHRGSPTVLVVWGSWCVECRVEQDAVNQAVEELDGTATFLGMDVRDNVGSAELYVREKQVPYPSIDANDGQALLAFQGTLAPYTVPAFVVLDAEGRVAASIIGRLPSTLTLVRLVEDVAEDVADAAVEGAVDG